MSKIIQKTNVNSFPTTQGIVMKNITLLSLTFCLSVFSVYAQPEKEKKNESKQEACQTEYSGSSDECCCCGSEDMAYEDSESEASED